MIIVVLDANNTFSVIQLERRIAAFACSIDLVPCHTQRINSRAEPTGAEVGAERTPGAFSIRPLCTVGVGNTTFIFLALLVRQLIAVIAPGALS